MAFKQVCRKSSLFRPWSPALGLDKEITVPEDSNLLVDENPLQSLKSFVVNESKKSECSKSEFLRSYSDDKNRSASNKVTIHNKYDDTRLNSRKDLRSSTESPINNSSKVDNLQYPSSSDFKITNSLGILPMSGPSFNHSSEIHDIVTGLPIGYLNRHSMLTIASNTRHAHVSRTLDSVVSSLQPTSWDSGNSPSVLLPMLPNINQPLENPAIPRWRAKKQRPKRFQCPHCQVSFSNNGQLKGHVRIHTGERPFACDHLTCGKTFTRNEELTRHKRIHTGVRPYPCPLCGKRFGRKDHLKKHVKTHQRAHLHTLTPTVASAFQGLHYFVSDGMPWF